MYTDLLLTLFFLSINNVTIILEKIVRNMLESGLTYVLLSFGVLGRLTERL